MPRVTAAVTTYNRADLVVGAVESVLAQTYGDREVLVIDDGSTDDTAARLEPYLEQIRYVRQANGGRSAARNRALAEASGELIAFLDSDDVWYSDALEREVAFFEGRPSLVLAFGHVDVIDGEGRLLPAETATHRTLFDETEASYAGWARRCMCLTSATMMRRDAVVAAGAYDPSIEANEDLDLYLRLALAGDVQLIAGKPLACYRLHSGQTGDDALVLGQIAVCLKHLDLLQTHEAPELRRARRNFSITLARSYDLLGDGPAVRHWTKEAVQTDARALLSSRIAHYYVRSFRR